MISHALSIVANELQAHLTQAYQVPEAQAAVAAGNIAEAMQAGPGGGNGQRDTLLLSLVNLQPEKALRNLPNAVRDDAALKVTYENPPLYLNLSLLLTATHLNYGDALLSLSRALRFFQATRVLTHQSVAPASLTTNAPNNPLDQLAEFRLIFDLCSPDWEDVSHLWGTLGGKQVPFALYQVRLLDLQFRSVQGEGGLITEIDRRLTHLEGSH